ncbi:hypothetical protein [Leptothrix discophora]|uniref:MFS transporter n=1 Tax=Leptothrix discophora TaxID=89 RepID=A0ABT9G442_LEPDI|nr:hypothetical protein [Leptothrix discophora]MDP4301185.1 hypothetical protein [Leptothrix discophora]
MQLSPLERRLLPFIAVQASLSTLVGFGAVLVHAEGGIVATVTYTLLMLSAVMAGVVLGYGSGAVWRIDSRRLAMAAMLLAAGVLPFAHRHPGLLALAVGGFIGLAWAGRHWIELRLVEDAGRDRYAAHVTVTSVIVSLVAMALSSLWLTWAGDGPEAARGLYLGHAGLAAIGALATVRRLPSTPPIRLHQPWALTRQPGWRASMRLYGLSSVMFAVGTVMSASGAMQALGKASHYGWVATLATLAGAVGLWALRHRRHAGNRVRSMAWACLGLASAHILLGASAWVPALYVLHLVMQAGISPFWQASEQVLHQRAMDFHGSLADRIAMREAGLWLFRMIALGGFWLVMHGADPVTILASGAGLMALATTLEFLIGRSWLHRQDVADSRIGTGASGA